MQRNGFATLSRPVTSRRGMSMSGQLSMFDLLTLPGSISAISLPGSADGPTHSGSPAGPMIVLSGPAVAPASHSRQPADARVPPTKGTCGQSSTASSASADLQSSLESRLRARTDVHGSPEYVLTWKHWDLPAGEPICALRASARHTRDNGCIGWPTLIKRDGATLLRARRAPNATGSEPMAWVGGLVSGIVTENRAGLRMAVPVGLNPAWTSWLMGFPDEWPLSAPTATQLSRKSRPSSSKPQHHAD